MSLDQPGFDKNEIPPVKKSSVTITRILLFLVLLAAVGALGYDLLAKRNLNQAVEKLEKLNDVEDQTRPPNVTQDVVRAELGREPSKTMTKKNSMGQTIDVEHYDFGGVFYKHRLTVTYQFKTLYRISPHSVFRIGGRSEDAP